MKWSSFGRAAMALTSAVALGLSMTACGGGTIAYLWAVGVTATNNSQVVGYKVDDFTGNLTAIPGQPFSSGGANPVTLVIRPGGRFIYVINQGTGFTGKVSGTSEGIDLFSVGGSGTLTFEQHYVTQGFGHLWAAFDSSGTFLYVLDRYSPSGDGNGAITTFASDATNGRLNLVQQQASTQPGQTAANYLEVGQNPLRMASTGSCLYTLNSTGQNITAYSIASGQLGTVTTGITVVNSTSATSISGNGQYIFITDSQNSKSSGQIITYTVGGSCSLTPLSGGATPNSPNSTALNPVNTLLSTSGKYVYVLNSNSSNTTSNARGSTIGAYLVNTGNSGQLQEISGSPFPSGAGPTCAVEDPTSKYIYVSNSDGTITGYIYSDTSGQIANLQRGSTFKTSALNLTCLALSGAI